MQYLSEIDQSSAFEDLYLKVRAKEGRLLDDRVVAKLPYASKDQVANYKEWQARAVSIEQLKRYFQKIKTPHRLLDIGCGNGWGAAALADNTCLDVAAVDLNVEELEQADRVFRKPNLAFYYGNIFDDIFPAASFDYIVMNASAQYFGNIRKLIMRLQYFLKASGEIHIVDTPFYSDEEVGQARERTNAYYKSMGVPEMKAHYFHHRLSELSAFNYEVLNSATLWSRFIARFAASVPKHFKWIRIRK